MLIRKKLQLTQVKRWPICHVGKDQSVAEHSYGVMLIVTELLSDSDDEGLWLECITYALVHDMDEVETGDIPSPFKRKLRAECPEVIPVLDRPKSVSQTAKDVVKLADYLEAIYWLREYGGSRTATSEILGDIFDNLDRFHRNVDLPAAIKEKALWLLGCL